ncbi:hypothetical protein [Pseudosulfitobacter koreensis]|uniref:HD domain-containing protein n=1 Tax=Pseudosulfitobacter koreensis TaxID=2968472 RepID=A0ABT1Z085_9RHOB|nr:hypothetical protein [Pseudosulfitobacter koreense]MCR8826538.1 hypothetical protein [Pseudosulfitobacter koreense]
MCQTLRLLQARFEAADSPLWPHLCLRVACHDIGHTPYGHAGERIIQHLYDPEFSNSRQSHRYMFAGTEDWPEEVTPFAWYRSAPIQRLQPALERDLATLVDFFDDLENAVGDALDLRALGRQSPYDFLARDCSWSRNVRLDDDAPLPDYLMRVVMDEFAPQTFFHLAAQAREQGSEFLRSIAALRDLVAAERVKCAEIARIDGRAHSRIPALFSYAQDQLHTHLPSDTCDVVRRRIAIDIIASTNDLELS